MKNSFLSLIIIAIGLFNFPAYSQTESDTVSLGLPGDNLDLYGVLSLFQKSKTIEDFEKTLNLKENRFGFEPEVTAKISRVPGIRIYEIGISYYGRTYEEGKKIGTKDGFRAIWCILKYNLFDRKYLKIKGNEKIAQ